MKHPTDAARFWRALRWGGPVMAAVLPGVVITAAHATMLDVARFDFIDALGSDRYQIHWISDSYLLGSALGMAITGFVAARIGLRRAYKMGLLTFMFAAGACGLISDVYSMAPLRWIQGLGHGLIVCAAMVIVWRQFPRHREFAMALYGMAIFMPAATGFVLGGLLTTWTSWRLVFLINVPLGALALVVAGLLPREKPQATEAAGSKFDIVGFALLAITIASLCVALDLGQYWGWFSSRHFSSWFSIFIGSFAAFVAWGLLARRPLINLHVFQRRKTTCGLSIKVLLSINLSVTFGLLAAYMVNLRGYQWWQASLVALPAALTMVAGALVGLVAATPQNRKVRIFAGIAILIAVTWLLTALDLYTSKFWLAEVLAIWGLGAGLIIGPALVVIFEGLSLGDAMMLAGVFNISRALPAFAAATMLSTFWTQSTDAHFDTLRQNVQINRPIVEESYAAARQHFIAHGSADERSQRQSHALIGQWTHANARAFALADVFRALTAITATGLIAVLALPGAKLQAVASLPPAPSRWPHATATQ